MKKIALTAAVLMLTAGTALAVPRVGTSPGKIQNSKHDINAYSGATDQTGEICIYCHTPHNATIAVPLWNRNNPSNGNFTLYNSPTVTSAVKNARKLTTDSISLFCMSCHDGETGLGSAVVNQNHQTYSENGMIAGWGANQAAGAIQSATVENAKLGRDLSTTHPIGFDFTDVPGEDSGIRSATQIKQNFIDGARKAVLDSNGNTVVPAATSVQNFLYGTNGNMFECASCHRVHDPGTSGNFLRIENYKSALCLACHNK